MEVVLKFSPPTVDRGVDALTEFYQDPTWNLQHANDVFYLESQVAPIWQKLQLKRYVYV